MIQILFRQLWELFNQFSLFFFFKSAAWSKQIGSWEEKMDKKGEKEGQIGPSEDEWHTCQSLTTPKPTA